MTIKQYDYDKLAKYYDVLELKASDDYEMVNDFLDKIFKENKVKTVLDMTCGTGVQTIGLCKRDYKVTASDISKGMLEIAKKKAKSLKIEFHYGDIRTSKYGKFDAVISIFNAIGHLSKKDFEKAIRNVSENLNRNGLFVFDIFNLDFMKAGGFKDYEFIDTALTHEETKYVRFNKNKIDFENGLMGINQRIYIQNKIAKPQVLKESWDMQLYSADDLKILLEKNGFKVVTFYGGLGNEFIKDKSLSIFIVAKKK